MAKRSPDALPIKPVARRRGARASRWDGWSDDGEEVDADFDAVEIDDVVRQALGGRIDIAELDAM